MSTESLTGLRARVADFMERPIVNNVIIGVIVFNAILLGVETSDSLMARIGFLVGFLDEVCLAIFCAELAAKLFAHRLQFFKSGWNLFDFFIVGIALVPAAQSMSVLRALRILRVMRLMSAAPSIRRVIEGFLTALPGMGSVFMLMSLMFYIGSVISTKLFADSFPQWFGSIGASAYSLFQIMTLESWSMGIVRPVMEIYPYAWVFFVPFIMVTTFAVVNLLVGLIVNSMQDAASVESNAETDAYRDQVMERLVAIEKKLDEKS